MASLALNPVLLQNLEAAEKLPFQGDFAQMDDAAIMLELRAGNIAGFDFLIQKYRKPIIHFMYRMVRNQAIAEELAQEVFLRVYRSRSTYPCGGAVQHLALSHRHQPRRKLCSR